MCSRSWSNFVIGTITFFPISPDRPIISLPLSGTKPIWEMTRLIRSWYSWIFNGSINLSIERVSTRTHRFLGSFLYKMFLSLGFVYSPVIITSRRWLVGFICLINIILTRSDIASIIRQSSYFRYQHTFGNLLLPLILLKLFIFLMEIKLQNRCQKSTWNWRNRQVSQPLLFLLGHCEPWLVSFSRWGSKSYTVLLWLWTSYLVVWSGLTTHDR